MILFGKREKWLLAFYGMYLFTIYGMIDISLEEDPWMGEIIRTVMGVGTLIFSLGLPVYIFKARAGAYYRDMKDYQEEYLQAQLSYFQQYKENQEETRRFRHDLNNHLLCLSEMMQEGKREEAESYVNSLIKQEKALSPEVVTGDEMIEGYAGKLGMKQAPKAYVMQWGGALNAFSSFLFKKQYIQINAEIFEVAYREHQDMASLGFVIAHEMAHIYYGHATLHYHLPIWFSTHIPLVGAIASRTREYSADRLAQRISGTDGVEAMFMLAVDRHLYKMVDREDYLREAEGQRGFFVWLVNLLADHPVLCKRVRALDAWEGSGELY